MERTFLTTLVQLYRSAAYNFRAQAGQQRQRTSGCDNKLEHQARLITTRVPRTPIQSFSNFSALSTIK